PNLQANCFLLSEAVAWVAAAGSTLGRLAFLERLPEGDGVADRAARLDVGRLAFARCLGEVRGRLRRFDGELAGLRRGHYAPAVRAASLLFRRADPRAPAPADTPARGACVGGGGARRAGPGGAGAASGRGAAARAVPRARGGRSRRPGNRPAPAGPGGCPRDAAGGGRGTALGRRAS